MSGEKEVNWAEGLPHMEVREFIYYECREGNSSVEMDARICEFLFSPVKPVSSDLASSLSLIPEGWWWHLSHMEAKVTPTIPARGSNGMLHNGASYDLEGRPLSYSQICFSREELPKAVCVALLKAFYDLPAGFVVSASAKAEARLGPYRARRIRAKSP